MRDNPHTQCSDYRDSSYSVMLIGRAKRAPHWGVQSRFRVIYVTVPGKRDHLGNFFKIELLLQQGRVGFELQNALHI